MTATSDSRDDRRTLPSTATVRRDDGCDCREKRQRRGSLDALHPMPLVPSRFYARQSRALSMLKQIEYIRVSGATKSSGRTFYRVDVYEHDDNSRIPVHGRFALQTRKPRQPNYQVEHPFSEFLQLRDDTFQLARVSHVLDPCLFCVNIICFDAFNEAKPRWNTTWFRKDETVCKQLTVFLNQLLRLVTQLPHSGQTYCDGQDQIPRVILRFLRWSSIDAGRNSI